MPVCVSQHDNMYNPKLCAFVASTFYWIKKIILENSDADGWWALFYNIPSYRSPTNITEKKTYIKGLRNRDSEIIKNLFL